MNVKAAGRAGILAGTGLAVEAALWTTSGWTPQTFTDPTTALRFFHDSGETLRWAVLAGYLGSASGVDPPVHGGYSTILQVAIDANTRLVVALGDPQPGNHNDTTVYRSSGINDTLSGRPTMADGAYRGNPEVIIPYRKPPTAPHCRPGKRISTRCTAASAPASGTPWPARRNGRSSGTTAAPPPPWPTPPQESAARPG